MAVRRINSAGKGLVESSCKYISRLVEWIMGRKGNLNQTSDVHPSIRPCFYFLRKKNTNTMFYLSTRVKELNNNSPKRKKVINY